jgi:Putative zinc-finger
VTHHVSPEMLALYREGAVTAAKAARIDAHLAGCHRCSGIDAALTNLHSVLAATELPPMPDTLTVRIQMAIAGESAARAGTSHASTAPTRAAPAPVDSGVAAAGTGPRAAGAAAGTAGSGSAAIPGRPDLPERRRRRLRRFRRPDWSSPLVQRGLAAASAVVVIVGAGILFANARSASLSSGSGGGGAGSRVPATRPTAAGGVSRPGSFHAYARASAPMAVNYRLNGRIATTAAVMSHANFTPRSLPRMVRKQVASVTKLSSGVTTPGYQGAASRRSRIGGVSISALQGCLTVMSRGRTVLLVDVARFLGRPATIVVLKSLTAVNVFDVGIVGVGCSASNLDIIRMLSIPVR